MLEDAAGIRRVVLACGTVDLRKGIDGLATIIGTLLFMLFVNVKITVVVVLLTPISLFVAGFIAKKTYSMFQLQTQTRGEQTALIEEMVGNQKGVQAFNHEDEALAALNKVREARGISAYSGTGDVLKTEIQNERRRELFAEGHRLFDLKRRDLPMDRSNLTLDWSRVGLIPAGSDKLEMPIPQDEIDANGALTIADQNPAYK